MADYQPRRRPDSSLNRISQAFQDAHNSRHTTEHYARGVDVEAPAVEAYNILPLHDMLTEDAITRFPEIRAARNALQTVGQLASPEGWRSGMDLVDWIGLHFGFQEGNVKNQREHIVMLLANEQMRGQPESIERMDSRLVIKLRKKVLKNYTSWCSFLGKSSNVWLGRNTEVQEQRELLYLCLYLLIWGEAANLRFMPECLCYIFHHMAGEMNKILDHYVNDSGQPYRPMYTGKNAFLLKVITPMYKIVKAEADASKGGKAPHSAWRNYDDMNEFFWSKRCFTHLSWPLNLSCSYLADPSKTNRKIGKTGFVEQRSFWNIFRSFDHLWTGHILLLQAMVIMVFHSNETPWKQVLQREVQAKLFTIFITWGGLRVLQCLLDILMEYKLISFDALLTGIRMLLKIIVASIWTLVFAVLYIRLWRERRAAGQWTGNANTAFRQFLAAALVFILPEITSLVLFILPWIKNAVEKSNLRIVYALTWWFHSRFFVGRGLREGIWDNIKYTTFWLIVFLVKFSFSYFLQIKPLVQPTRELLALKNVEYTWYQFWGTGSNRVALAALWAPVLLIYFMDMQIWYTVFSSFAGALVGLFSHLGEIRNMEQVKLRFPFFASALAFNLTPSDSLTETGVWNNWIGNAWRRFKLRYGLINYRRQATDSAGLIEAGRFAIVWNDIINILREEDLLSNQEQLLLQIPEPIWQISVIQWPCVLLSNELHISLNLVTQKDWPDDRKLWKRICRSENRRCAVIECYESIRYILKSIIREGSEEETRFNRIFSEIENSLHRGTFVRDFKIKQLPNIHEHILALLKALNKKRDNRPDVVFALQNLYEVSVFDFSKETMESRHDRPKDPLFVRAIKFPREEDETFFNQLKRIITICETKESMLNVPENLEARRRITFFSNSLFMKMPRAPPVDKMLGFSVLTPYYEEDVMYNRKAVESKNEDGISIIFYLQKIFRDEWRNFLERIASDIVVDEDEWIKYAQKNGLKLAGKKQHWKEYVNKEGHKMKVQDFIKRWKLDPDTEKFFWEHVRLWASYRGQTLARTVRGMMYYHKALRRLAYLDGASELDIKEGRKLKTSSDDILGNSKEKAEIDAISNLKFTYVVACQKYGEQKEQEKDQAKDIFYLMKTHSALRVAYVDEKTIDGSKKFFSVLVKYDQHLKNEVEVYRVQLPGPLRLGEGKPENQNHAIIFTRGDAVQTIDMNQDNYYEEALKARNLLQEFTVNYGLRKPTILGVREHVFTGSVSSLASFMSAQETSFVTLGQRVLAKPLKVRMHYGHPDVFDRLWFATRGGISKASRVINISEDIFAGFNCTLRGGNVTHHEYIQAGKGRDVGINQIALFEAKVASGNGEQILSRDVYRLGHRLDFFRMVSFYYTTVGFFISNMIVALTVYAFLWGRVYITLSGIDKSIEGQSVFANAALTSSLNQQFLVQLGIFTALPMIVENSIEHGFVNAVWDFIIMQLQLSFVFFTFSLGTRAHYFGRTVLHGGAKYRATGRGFVVVHEKFAHIYRMFARSHFVKGVELIFLLIIYQSFAIIGSNATAYFLITFSSWILALSWILGPFLFNPVGFDSLKVSKDFDDFWDWLWQGKYLTIDLNKDNKEKEEEERKKKEREEQEKKKKEKETGQSSSQQNNETVDQNKVTKKKPNNGHSEPNKAERSWEIWWNEELDHLKTTGIWGKILEVVLSLRFFFLQYGVVYQLRIANQHKGILVYVLSWVYMAVIAAVCVILMAAQSKYSVKKHMVYRIVQAGMTILLVVAVALIVSLTDFEVLDLLRGVLVFVPAGWGLLSILCVFKGTFEEAPWWRFVVGIARLYELGIALVVFIPIMMLTWVPGFQEMQTRILFNTAFSRGLQIELILSGKKQVKDRPAAKKPPPNCSYCKKPDCHFQCLQPKDTKPGEEPPLLSYYEPKKNASKETKAS